MASTSDIFSLVMSCLLSSSSVVSFLKLISHVEVSFSMSLASFSLITSLTTRNTEIAMMKEANMTAACFLSRNTLWKAMDGTEPDSLPRLRRADADEPGTYFMASTGEHSPAILAGFLQPVFNSGILFRFLTILSRGVLL